MSGPFGSTAWMANPASGFYDFPISNSLRFEDGDSAYLNRTPSSAGNRRTWTFSTWVKRANLGVQFTFFGARGNNANEDNSFQLVFKSSDAIAFGYGGGVWKTTTQLFRDPSAWLHVVFALDTTQGTGADRTKLYINGTQVTSFTVSNTPGHNLEGGINKAIAHRISHYAAVAPEPFDGYLAETCLIDGTALTGSSFGELKNDIWIPKDTSGLTFGTNGFRLEYKQVGTGTASTSTIGADTSGETNHWTSNNLVASDVMPDTPTNNFCTPNALDNMDWISQGLGRVTRSEGNLQMSGDSWITKSTFGMLTGKWYWEVRLEGGAVTAGIHLIDGLQDTHHAYYYYGYTANAVYKYAGNATLFDGDAVAADSILGVAFDADNLTLQYFINGSSIHTVSSVDAGKYSPSFGTAASSTLQVNFGQDSSFAGNETAQGNADGNGIGDFYHAPPSGFLALCTANLPDPVATIDPNEGGSPQDYFNTVLYTGNASTQNITGVGFQPDWVWIKPRSYIDNNVVFDSVRGVNQTLYTNTTGGEADRTGNDSLTAFGSDGFSIGDWNNINTNNATLVSWNWKAGTSFSNDASSTSVGTIDSAGSVNTDIGFSIIGYTGVSADATVAHGLGVAPDFIIAKIRSNAGGEGWPVFHRSMGVDEKYLDKSNAQTNGTTWNDVLPTSAVFSVNGNDWTNKNGSTMIAYCFASVDGYSKFGSYTGNGNANGTFVYTGFRPALIIYVKTASENWHMKDNKTAPFNVMTQVNDPNRNGAEVADANTNLDFLSNGFKLRSSHGTHNEDNVVYIYMAFAEQPFKYANAK